MSKFLPTSGFKLIAPEDFDSNKHSSNSPIVSVLEVHLEYPQRLWKFHDSIFQPQIKTEIQLEMAEYQLMISTFYNISIGNVKKLVPFLIKKSIYLQLYLMI